MGETPNPVRENNDERAEKRSSQKEDSAERVKKASSAERVEPSENRVRVTPKLKFPNDLDPSGVAELLRGIDIQLPRISIPAGVQWRDLVEGEGTSKLRTEIASLQKQLSDAVKQARTEQSDRQKLEEELTKVGRVAADLQQKQDLEFLLTKTTWRAHEKLLTDVNFRNNFIEPKLCPTFVLSMDLRRSTELMLKARAPELFADFMTDLCRDLTEIIKDNFGVVDKFTGDGMLAFFPDFFSGPDAGYYAIATAEAAHKRFAARYREHRKSFMTVLNNVGMGIGLDYGEVRLVQVAGGLTVVGPAVVYACRMGSAPPDKTYLNQPAYEKISAAYGNSCFINETEIEIKHEGGTLAYDLRLTNDKPFIPSKPPWLES